MIQTLMGAGTFVLAGLAATALQAATITVATNGDLQSAINSAQPGDVITLVAGASYVGNFVLPAKLNPNGLSITIKTAVSPDKLPGAGKRILPTDSSRLPKIKSPNTAPALQTAPGARFWVLQYLEFQANDRGYGDIITLGSGDPAVQTSLAQVPGDLVIDHCYIHGDAALGQKRGIALNSGKTDIVDSHISDIKAIGFETQAIAGWNGPGPYRIVNNFIESAGINFILGGADPGIPDLVPQNVEFRRNHVTKKVAWREPALATPTNLKATTPSNAGSLQGTVHYTVVAVGTAAMGTPIFSQPTKELAVRFNRPGSAKLSWNTVAGASRYRVYRSTIAGSQTAYVEVTSATLVDNGDIELVPGGIPWAARWTVKNLVELKNSRNVVIEGNVLENNWTDAQTGYAVLFTVRNQDGSAPWSTVDNVTFSNNIVRHAPGGISILGRDNLHPSELTKNIVIRNNLFDDLTGTWGFSHAWLLLGDGADRVTLDHNTVVHTEPSLVMMYGSPTTNFVYTHNMGRKNEYGFMGDNNSPGNGSIATYVPGAVFSKNIITGASAWNYPASNEPCGRNSETCYPSEAEWQAQFVNFADGNYRLLTTSPYAGAGAGGTDLGANIDAIIAATAGVAGP